MSPQRESDDRDSGEQRFRLLVESVQDYAIFMLDPGGHVTSWNLGAARMKGYTESEILGQHFSTFYRPEDANVWPEELEAAVREGRVENEGLRVRKDGSTFWANVVITALRDHTGTLVGFAKVTRDLTERREYQREVATRQRLEALGELAEALATAIVTEEVALVVVESGRKASAADICTLYLLDESTGVLELVAERGCAPEIVERIRHITATSGNPVYDTLWTRKSLWIETEEEYVALYPALATARAQGPRANAFWSVPLVVENRAIGLLGMGFYSPRRFSPENRAFVETFARHSAQALLRAQRLEAERAARKLAERLQASLSTTLRSIGDAVIATDSRGSITLMNDVAQALTGFSEEEARGRRLHEVFHIVNEQTREEVVSPVDKVLASGTVVGLANHTVLLSKDGREIPIDDSGAPIRGEDGSIAGVVLVFRDVRERRETETRRAFLAETSMALTESLDYEETLKRVAELTVPRLADWCTVDLVVGGESEPRKLALAHVDPKKVEFAQKLAAKYQRDPNATRGVPNVLRTGRAEIYPDIAPEMIAAGAVDEEHLRLLQALTLRSAMIVPLVARGQVLGAVTFVYAESGRTYSEDDLAFAQDLCRTCAIALDNARLYAAEQRARQRADVANRAKDEFLATISHELRTPLNAIMGWAKMLAVGGPDYPKQERALESIRNNAVAMAQLIEDLLDVSRIIGGKMRLEIVRVELARVIEAAMESVRPSADARGISLVTALDSTIRPLMADPARLQQIVWNLLSNAVKFTPKGGSVEVALARDGSSVALSVTDSGKGIAPAFLPNVFDPFRQEETGTTRSKGGLGLGLAITKQLVELHGGRIEARSAGDGYGATFIVTLPITAVAHALSSGGDEVRKIRDEFAFERPPQLENLRVLVVDDEPDARQLITAVLEECGSRVVAAASVEEAIEILSNERPDVLISDIGMPEQDGYDLIRQVRARPAGQGGDIPAAALTAYTRAEDRHRVLDAGYSMHIPKPVEPADLVAVVASLVRFVPRS